MAALIWAAIFAVTTLARSDAGSEVWLAAGDIHLNLFDRSSLPSGYRSDGNEALLDVTIARMRRVAPNPAVVVLTGDFLVHDFKFWVARQAPGTAPEVAALETMRRTAAAFGRAFPHARFVVALGNNDAPCGDYRAALGSPYLAAVARIWAPLAARGGDSSGFITQFERGGYYATALPAGQRAIVANSVLFSKEFRGDCRGDSRDAGRRELEWLRSALDASPRTHTILVMHIPPGFDPLATTYARGLLAWPFLNSGANAALDTLLTAPQNRIAFVLTGHAHRFDFRLAGGVPVVTIGSVSPIYGNNPAFYTLRVAADGSLDDIVAHTFDVPVQRWQDPRSFDATWNVARVDAPSLARLHARLGRDAQLRARWQMQADGWPSHAPNRGIWLDWWQPAFCAQRYLDDGFARCAGVESRRRAFALAAAAVLIAALTALLVRKFARGGTTLKPP